MEKDLTESSKKYNSVNLCNESQERDGLKCYPVSDSTPLVDSSVPRDLKHRHHSVERDSDSPRSSENARHSGRHSKTHIRRSSRSSERNVYKDRSHRSSKKGSKHDREYRSRSCEKSPKSPEVSRRRSKKRSDSRDRGSREWRQVEGSRDDDGSVKRDRSRHTDRYRSEGYHRVDLQQIESTHNVREDRHRRRDQERTRLRRHDSDTRHGRLSRSGCDDDRYTQRGYHDRHFPRSSSQHSQAHSRGYLCDGSPDGDPRVWPHPFPPPHNPCSPCGGSGHPSNLAEVPRWSQANGKHPTKMSQADGQSADDQSVGTVTSEPLPPGLDADTDRQPAGYCFVEFSDPNAARMAMLRLNSKTIPNSVPPKRFKLNLASFRNEHLLVPEFSLFVGELSEDVDDYMLYSAFSARYKSCYAVKVVLSSDGHSRGFGFIRFTDETDQQRALLEMQNYTGIGQKPIKVSMATPKGRMNRSGATAQYNWPQTYQQQQQQWWQAYQQPASYYYSQDATANMDAYATQSVTGMDDYGQCGQAEEEVLEDPDLDVDIDKMNKEFMEQSEELYTALEGSRWHPLDNVMSPISVNTK